MHVLIIFTFPPIMLPRLIPTFLSAFHPMLWSFSSLQDQSVLCKYSWVCRLSMQMQGGPIIKGYILFLRENWVLLSRQVIIANSSLSVVELCTQFLSPCWDLMRFRTVQILHMISQPLEFIYTAAPMCPEDTVSLLLFPASSFHTLLMPLIIYI